MKKATFAEPVVETFAADELAVEAAFTAAFLSDNVK
jgi:hypothetical protein